MSQKSVGSAWDLRELYLIEKTRDALGKFSAATVSSFARTLMSVHRPSRTHGPGCMLVGYARESIQEQNLVPFASVTHFATAR